MTEATTVEDLDALFVDLPEPHPRVGAEAVPVSRSGRPPASRADAPTGLERWGPPVSGALPIMALVLFLTVPIPHAWVFFLLIPLGGALFARSRRADGPDERT